ncbi:MAG: NfeD family protein [Cyanobacteria bacterium P01_C01_bin.120]
MSLSDFFQVTEMSPFQGRGIVQQAIAPPYAGRVYFRATYWPARLSQTAKLDKLQPGAPVEVVGRDGLTLLVKPLN